jgi:hypothetical protein
LEDAGRMFAWCAAALVATFPTLSAVTVNEVYSGKSAEVITARVNNICVKAIRFPLCKAYILLLFTELGGRGGVASTHS